MSHHLYIFYPSPHWDVHKMKLNGPMAQVWKLCTKGLYILMRTPCSPCCDIYAEKTHLGPSDLGGKTWRLTVWCWISLCRTTWWWNNCFNIVVDFFEGEWRWGICFSRLFAVAQPDVENTPRCWMPVSSVREKKLDARWDLERMVSQRLPHGL